MEKLVWKEDLRFSQWCLGGLESPETWRRVDWYMTVREDFFVNGLILNKEKVPSSETSVSYISVAIL